MSSSLVRKGLELLEAESISSAQPLKPRKNGLKAKRKDRQRQQSRLLGDIKSGAARQIEQVRKIASKKSDKTSENLENLIALSKSQAIDFNGTQRILDQTVKRRPPLDDTAPAPTSGSSLFTEKDFEKFEKEYFVSN